MPPCSEPTDGGQSWHELSGLREHGSGPRWQPGAGGMCLHTIILDPSDPKRIYIAISAAGAFRSDDGGQDVEADQSGLQFAIHSRARPRKWATACTTSRCTRRARACCSCKSIGTSCAATTPAKSWTEVSGNLPTDFGFVIDVHAHRARNHLRGADQERLRALSARGQAARLSQPHRRERVGAAHQGPAAERLLRQRAARRHGGGFARSNAASISAPPAGRCTHRRMRATLGRRLSAIFRPCFRSRCRRCA